MNSSVTGSLLVEEPIERFRSFGAFGSPVWQGHAQLRALVRQRIDERHANVFAVPTYDPETARMRWTSPLLGVVRPWQELSADERVRYSTTLDELRRGLADLVGKLRSPGEGRVGSSTGFASLLEQAMKVPAEGRFLFLVDDQPVIAFWGFENANGGSAEGLASAVAVLPGAGLAPLPGARSWPEGRPEAVLPAAAPTIDMTQVAPAPVLAKRRAWLHWLLLGLGLLLLLLSLLFLLRSCIHIDTPGSGSAMPSVLAPDPTLPGAGGGGSKGVPVAPSAGTPSAVDPSAPLGAAGGGASPAASVAGSTKPGVVSPSQPAVPNSPADPPQGPARSSPPQNKPPEGQTRFPIPNEPGAPNSPANLPQGPARSSPPQDKPLQGQTRLPVPNEPESLRLPTEPRAGAGMEFLLGDWKAGEGLVDKNTKLPLDISMKFGPGGRGEMTVRRPDGTACTGVVQGRMESGRLTVEGNRSVPCVDGGSYGAPKIECGRTSGGQTQCEGVNRDGSRYFVDIKRP